ncbi:MAG: GNAT family N-acetyltransferase [Flavobacteriaceae bacterium]|jgi:GNAT superfamily N-acetyltransferase
MNVTLRPAEKQDSEAILRLIQELAVFEKEPESVLLTVSDIERYGFGSSPLFQCLVAQVEQQVIGMALYYQRFSTWKGPTYHLEDLIVTEAYKGKGIGTQLYTAFIQMAYESGVERIEWNVLDWNTPAVGFYEKSGATVLHDWSSVQMHKAEMEAFLKNVKE